MAELKPRWYQYPKLLLMGFIEIRREEKEISRIIDEHGLAYYLKHRKK